MGLAGGTGGSRAPVARGAGRAPAAREAPARRWWKGAPAPALFCSSLSLGGTRGGAGVAPDRRLSGGHAGEVAAPVGGRAAAALAGGGRARSSPRLLLPLLCWVRNPTGFGFGFNPKPDPFTPEPDPLKV